jgi:hypothetical protein
MQNYEKIMGKAMSRGIKLLTLHRIFGDTDAFEAVKR